MFIYIDESGNFSRPRHGDHAYSCAGALTISERKHGEVLKSFKTLKRRWGRVGDEVKGRELDEHQTSQVIGMLVSNRVKFHACVTDTLLNTHEMLASRKVGQAELLLAGTSDQIHSNFIKEFSAIGKNLCEMSDQLFVQLNVMIQLINAHLHDVMIHYAKFSPKELGAFRWVVDQKNDRETKYEAVWKSLLPAFIHGQQFYGAFDEKIVLLEGGNYDYFDRFRRKLNKWPSHLPEPRPGIRNDTNIDVADIYPILRESFLLGDSSLHLGLQLADIVTNALRRAIVGNLQESGWCELGRLMFKWKGCPVQFVHFDDGTGKDIELNDAYAVSVANKISENAGFVLNES